MKTLQYPLGITPEKVRAIHAYYEAQTHRKTLLDARIEAGWVSLLSARSLAGDPVTLEDLQLVIRYLQKRVVDPKWKGPRHPGCLKLTVENFFGIERFRQDLAEARAIWNQRSAAKRSTPPPAVVDRDAGGVHSLVEEKREREAKPMSDAARETFADLRRKFGRAKQ
jgi:hypothetical protein